ncbi:MAG: 5'/3'-nucleotidase SurE [Chloroflexota bacterium]|nr:5'/3'-nucleotidase SurE [Chloroflexota bacterium]
MNTPLILLTNDDGIHSPGLLAAAHAVCDLGRLVIVAPQEQQSGMGRSLPKSTSGAMYTETLPIDGCPVAAYSMPGSPAQTVLYAITDLLDEPPSLVISGINYGENLGTSTTVSGTVGAALQAGEAGIPGLAVSLETDPAAHHDPHYSATVDWTAAAYFTRLLAQKLLAEAMPGDVDTLNVNVPGHATVETPWRLTRQSRQPYYQSLPTHRTDLSAPGQLSYKTVIDWQRLRPETDIHAFAVDHVVSVTPLSLDLTSRVGMDELKALLGSQ